MHTPTRTHECCDNVRCARTHPHLCENTTYENTNTNITSIMLERLTSRASTLWHAPRWAPGTRYLLFCATVSRTLMLHSKLQRLEAARLTAMMLEVVFLVVRQKKKLRFTVQIWYCDMQWPCSCMYLYIYMYMCICTYICIYLCIYTYIYIYIAYRIINTCINIYAYKLYIFICAYRVWICIQIFRHICWYTHVHMHIHILYARMNLYVNVCKYMCMNITIPTDMNLITEILFQNFQIFHIFYWIYKSLEWGQFQKACRPLKRKSN